MHPGAATIGSEVRTVDGMDRDRLESELRATIAGAVPDGLSWELRFREDRLGWMPPSRATPDHPVVAAAQRAADHMLGRGDCAGGLSGRHRCRQPLAAQGLLYIASLGPGFITCAHGPNEFVSVSALQQAVDLYERLAVEFVDGMLFLSRY